MQLGPIPTVRSFVLTALLGMAMGDIGAQTLTPEEEAARTKLVESEKPRSRVAIYGWVEGSVTGNPAGPSDHQNFGRLFDDRSNEFVMNQAVINAERTLDPKIGFDWGFKLQLMFGTDARYIHSLGMRYHEAGGGLYQGDVPEAYLSLHLPLLTAQGVDVKLGKFVTLEGAETIDPRTNVFYSHTYIFNFGIPLNHTGALFTLHTYNWLDFIVGVTRGVNTSIDDNNDRPAFHGGIGLNLNEGKTVILVSTHVGPETYSDDSDIRCLSDATITWKMTDKLTSITDLNYAYDGGANASAYGMAQYLTYAINDAITIGARGEIWRDNNAFFVAQFADPSDPIRALGGEPVIDPRTLGGTRTTYGAFTVGLQIKLPSLPKPLKDLRIRPELRVDHALDGTPFNDSTDATMFTAALDAILTF